MIAVAASSGLLRLWFVAPSRRVLAAARPRPQAR